MSTTSKSPRKVLLAAYAIGRTALPDHPHRCAPRIFTQPQLFACLALKAFFKTDYRGIAAYLHDLPDLRHAIGLKRTPHFTTLQKAADRFMRQAIARQLLSASVQWNLQRRRRIRLAAIDATGFETRHVSPYFVRRRSRTPGVWQTTTYTRFPKMGGACDCDSHVILALWLGSGPGSDVKHFTRLLWNATRRVKINTVVADAGYDAEASHVFARETLGIRSIIPARIGRPTARPPTGRWRRHMRQRFNRTAYGQRWQIETVFSMIKRRMTACLAGRSYWSRCREMMLLAITHNAMILLCMRRFSTEHSRPLFRLQQFFLDKSNCM